MEDILPVCRALLDLMATMSWAQDEPERMACQTGSVLLLLIPLSRKEHGSGRRSIQGL